MKRQPHARPVTPPHEDSPLDVAIGLVGIAILFALLFIVLPVLLAIPT